MGSQNSSTNTILLREVRDLGNDRAWRKFLGKYEPMLRRWCERARLGRDEVETVVATLLAGLVRVMPSFDYQPEGGFRKYLKAAVCNAVRDSLRQKARRPGDWGQGGSSAWKGLEAIPDPSSFQPFDDTNDAVELDGLVDELDQELEPVQATRRAVMAVKARVQAHTWEAFNLTVLENRTASEAAEKLGMSTLAVYVARNRIVKMLRQEFAKLQRQDEGRP
jgi:RNA polymerase sigma factor (sigma-70 family)